MNRVLAFVVVVIFFGLVPMMRAQMRGGGGGMSQGQSSAGGMQGQHSQAGTRGMGQSGPMLTNDQRRQMMHTTKTQDTKYSSCAQAMNKVRDRIKHMTGNSNAGQNLDAQPPDSGGDQLDSDIQDVEQDQNDFLDSLSDDQKTALESQIKDVQKKMKQLDAMSKELKAELEGKTVDSAKIREQAKKLDKLSKAIQNEQHLIAGALGIQS